jgi:hypothetical protein
MEVNDYYFEQEIVYSKLEASDNMAPPFAKEIMDNYLGLRKKKADKNKERQQPQNQEQEQELDEEYEQNEDEYQEQDGEEEDNDGDGDGPLDPAEDEYAGSPPV